MKRLTIVQWINLNQNNRFVLALRYPVLREKAGPIFQPLEVFAAGRQADEIWVSFEIFKILCRLNYLGYYFVYYHCNVTTVLELHFSQLLASKAYFKVFLKCKKFGCQFYTR